MKQTMTIPVAASTLAEAIEIVTPFAQTFYGEYQYDMEIVSSNTDSEPLEKYSYSRGRRIVHMFTFSCDQDVILVEDTTT